MKILFCSHNGNLEGAPIMLLTLASECKKNGHECLMVLASSGFLEDQCKEKGIPYTVDTTLLSGSSSIVRKEAPDLVIANTCLSSAIVTQCHIASVPVFWIIHESNTSYIKKFGITSNHFISANAVIFPSAYTRDLYAKYDTGNFFVFPNGIDVEKMKSFQFKNKSKDFRSLYHIPQDAFVFLSVGTMCLHKGFRSFVKAGIKLLEENPDREIHFIIAGTIVNAHQQEYADILLNLIWKNDVRRRFHIYANMLNVYDFFVMADAYVCASEMETFPMSILEAMMFNLPITSHCVGGIPEQIIDGIHGKLITADDNNALTESMHDIMKDPKHHQIIREAARNRVVSAFSSKSMYARYENIMPTVKAKSKKDAPVHKYSDNRDVNISLIMRASKAETIPDSVQSAIATFPFYSEFIFSVSPTLPRKILRYLRNIPRSKIVQGTDNREDAGDSHYKLIDLCTSTWIANVDDDDLWITAPSLSSMSKDISLVYGYHFFLNYYYPKSSTKRFVVEKGYHVDMPNKANGVTGSNWILRREAWNSISNQLTDKTFSHSDWRIYYFLVKAGWKTHWEQSILGVIKRFSFKFSSDPNTGWGVSIQKLDSQQKQQETSVEASVLAIVLSNNGEYTSQTIDSLLAQKTRPTKTAIIGSHPSVPPLARYDSDFAMHTKLSTDSIIEDILSDIKDANAKYVLLLRENDLLKDNFISEGVNLLESNKCISGIYAKTQLFGSDATQHSDTQKGISCVLLRNDVSKERLLIEQWYSNQLRENDDWKFLTIPSVHYQRISPAHA